MRHRSTPIVTALAFGLALSLVGATSYARYLSSIGPAACCQSHCPRSHGTAKGGAARCCSTHLGVLPAGLATTGPDVQHAFGAAHVTAPLPAIAWTGTIRVPSATVIARGSPPGSLVASHTALLI